MEELTLSIADRFRIVLKFSIATLTFLGFHSAVSESVLTLQLDSHVPM